MKMIAAIYAEDPILRAETLKEIVDALVDPADRVFDVKELFGDRVRAFDIVTALESWPIGNQHKVVIVRDAEKLTNEDAEKILAAAPELPDFAVLILVVDPSSPSKLPAKLKEAAKEHAYQVGGGTKSDKAQVATAYVRRLFDSAGVKVSTGIVSSIVDRAGTECLVLRGEVVKIIDFCWTPQGHREITETILDTAMSDTEDDVTFRLVDAVVSGNLSGAITLLRNRMAATDDTTDGEAFRILSLLRRQFLLVAQTKMLLDRGIDVSRSSIPGTEPLYPEPKYDLREILKRSSWQGRKLVPMARGASWQKVVMNLALVGRLEELMKDLDGLLSDPERVMAFGVMSMCS